MSDLPNKRPKPGDDEEDLLRMQQEFLDKKLTPSAKVVGTSKKQSKFAQKRENENEKKRISTSQGAGCVTNDDIDMDKLDDTPTQRIDPVNRYYDLKNTHLILGNIVERKVDLASFNSFLPDSNSNKPKEQATDDHKLTELSKMSASNVVTGALAEDVHSENLEKLKQMSNEEILAEKKNLEATLSAETLAFIKSMRNAKNKCKDTILEMCKKDLDSAKACSSSVEDKVSDSNAELPMDSENSETLSGKMEVDLEEGLKELPKPVVEIVKTAEKKGWVHMDEPEPEKVQWMEDLAEKKAQAPAPDEPYNARFDFNGLLLPFNDDAVTVDRGLHHHGEEPERPGYALQELLQLTRSANQQQRVMALTTLANILEKTHTGMYDRALQPPLFDTLNQRNLLLLLRFALDDSAVPVVTAALLALRGFLFSETDEICLDKMYGLMDDFEEPTLKPSMGDVRDTESLKDHELAQLDTVAAAMRSDILLRIRYILSQMKIPLSGMSAALEILTRMARHSHETALNIACTPDLLDVVVTKCIPLTMNQHEMNRDSGREFGCPLVAAIRLCRVLVIHAGRPALERLKNLRILHSLLAYVYSDPNRQIVRLHIESLRLWRLFLHHGYERDSVVGSRIVLIGQLRLLACNQDLEQASPLACDYAAAVVALARYDEPLKEHVVVLLAKWSTQLAKLKEATWNQTVLVAECLRALDNVGFMVRSWMKKHHVFHHMSTSSNLLSGLDPAAQRDPSSLPSLGVMTYEGKLQPIVNPKSKIYFLKTCLELFLKHDCTAEIEQIFDNMNFKNYLKRLTSKTWSLERSWFTRVEYSFLLTIIQAEARLKCAEKYEINELVWRCAIKLVSALPADCASNVRDILVFSLAPERIDLRFLEHGLQRLDLQQQQQQQQETSSTSSSSSQENPSLACKLYDKFVARRGSWSEAAMPKDWVYLPLIDSYSRIREDKAWRPSSTVDILNLLKLESVMPELTQDLSPTLRFSRLVLLYLCDTAFILPPENELPSRMIAQLVREHYKEIDLAGDVPGLTSFADLFTVLCEGFIANSYGQACFAQALCVFLAQRQLAHYRKLLWSEHAGALRYIGLTPQQLLLPYDEYLYPVERDVSLIDSYITALVRDTVRPEQSPALYNVALHHAAMFLKRAEEGGEEDNVALARRRSVEKMLAQERTRDLAEKLLNYNPPILAQVQH
ncbi:RNA polymerase II-associated protein 1 [Trichogramma pretiosum]|uniref:RNA polymerase II-associated protein 1 n=1 Tax=Trichogramma pretiosum TaxID=7493 RepID=UPI0006C98287|nr:RNA polymerase II-associated protein 1 [Trichogramma pretiosum]